MHLKKDKNNYEGFGTDKDIYSAKSFCMVHRMIDLFESLIKKHTFVINSEYVKHNKMTDTGKGILARDLMTPVFLTW